MTSQRPWARELLHFWFHTLGPAQWFSPDPGVDAEIRRRFSPVLAAMKSRPTPSFLTDPDTALAAILLFDQVPRNLYRDSARAFAFDARAKALSRAMIASAGDRSMARSQRQFMAMPMMHSERIADQRMSLAYYTRLGQPAVRSFAIAHHRMIARFGRFPHRNAVLNRKSSEAEKRAVAQGFSW